MSKDYINFFTQNEQAFCQSLDTCESIFKRELSPKGKHAAAATPFGKHRLSSESFC
jgi:hypothetical protein